MKLLPEKKLVWSPIVVNSRMNRERNASGINSYEQEFKFKPEEYLADKIKANGQASWLDLCCGQGKAIIQSASFFYHRGQQQLVTLKGIDLIDTFLPVDKNITCVEFKVASLIDWIPDQSYDLITCVHGLHYLGDKLKVLENSIHALNPGGLFIANLDLNNIVIQGIDTTNYLKKSFKENGLDYNSKTRILKKNGSATIAFSLTYVGADDEQGPNYTGQDAVTSWYTVSV